VIGYTVAGRAVGFAIEQPLHVVAFACSASGISKQLEYTPLLQTENANCKDDSKLKNLRTSHKIRVICVLQN
jgi:hypothetical protein